MNEALRKEIDKNILEIHERIPRVVFDPVNYKEEREKFISEFEHGKKYILDLKYRTIPDVEPLLEELTSLRKKVSIETELDNIFAEKIDSMVAEIELVKFRNTEKFNEVSSARFGCPDDELIAHAQKILNQDANIAIDKVDKISSQEISKMFENAFEQIGLKNWEVIEQSIVPYAVVYPKKNKVVVQKDVKLWPTTVKKLIYHELATHVFRRINGLAQPYHIFSIGFSDYLAVEEGIAVYNEQQIGFDISNRLQRIAARVIAVDMAVKLPFSKVYEFFRERFKPRKSFNLALRAKRSVGDIEQPGAYTKDYLYLKGYLELLSYLESGGSLEDLYVGKVAVRDIPVVHKMKDVVPPKLMPSMLDISKL